MENIQASNRYRKRKFEETNSDKRTSEEKGNITNGKHFF